MKLKDRIKKELVWALIYAIPLSMPVSMGYMETSTLLQMGCSGKFIEKMHREELPEKRSSIRDYIGSVSEFTKRPGRKLAYATVDQYKFPWKGYHRRVFR